MQGTIHRAQLQQLRPFKPSMDFCFGTHLHRLFPGNLHGRTEGKLRRSSLLTAVNQKLREDTFLLISASSEIWTNCLASMNVYGWIPVGKILAESIWWKTEGNSRTSVFSLINQKTQKSKLSAEWHFQVFFSWILGRKDRPVWVLQATALWDVHQV